MLRNWISLVALALAGCQAGPQSTLELDPAELHWQTYVDATLGYSLDHPSQLHPDSQGDGNVLFRHRGVPVLVRYHDAEEGRRRGAWFGREPVRAIRLADRPGELYVYEHADGPFATRTIAYVVPYRGKFLGLEFRAVGELDPVQERVLESFRLPPDEPAAADS